MSEEQPARMSFAELADIFAGMTWSHQKWLRDHGPQRGEMETDQKRGEFMQACERAAQDYRRAAERGDAK